MKKIYRLGALILLTASCTLPGRNEAASGVHLTVFTADTLPWSDTLFITGSTTQLGGWNGRGLPFERDVDNPLRWTLHFQSVDSAFAYKLTLGDWSHEAKLAEGMAFRDLGGWRTMDTTLYAQSFGMAERVNDGQVSGYLTVMDAPMDPKGIIPSRKMWVWTPYDLKQTDWTGPVDLLLMSDGQNCIDPATSTFGVDWAVDEAILALMEAGRIRPTIVVALQCATEGGDRRRLEYGPGELGEAFTDYLVHTVLAQVLENPILSSESHVYFAGSSMGGVLAFRLLTEYPDVFDGALAFSPAVCWETGNGLVVDAIGPWRKNGRPAPSGYLYVDNGGVGLEAQLQPGIDLLLKELEQSNYPVDHLKWVRDKKAEHSEVAWRQRFPDALAWLAVKGDWVP